MISSNSRLTFLFGVISIRTPHYHWRGGGLCPNRHVRQCQRDRSWQCDTDYRTAVLRRSGGPAIGRTSPEGVWIGLGDIAVCRDEYLRGNCLEGR